MKTPFATEVDLGPSYIVLDGDPAAPKGVQQPPSSCRPMSIVVTVAHFSYCWALVSGAHDRDRPTDRQRELAAPSVTIGSIYVLT